MLRKIPIIWKKASSKCFLELNSYKKVNGRICLPTSIYVNLWRPVSLLLRVIDISAYRIFVHYFISKRTIFEPPITTPGRDRYIYAHWLFGAQFNAKQLLLEAVIDIMCIFGSFEPWSESTFPSTCYYSIEASDVTLKHHTGSPVCLHTSEHSVASMYHWKYRFTILNRQKYRTL